jgi:hypothetical protein
MSRMKTVFPLELPKEQLVRLSMEPHGNLGKRNTRSVGLRLSKGKKTESLAKEGHLHARRQF